MDIDLALVWALLIAASVFLYVVLDGFDLGIGILFPTAASSTERDVMMNSIAPVWDGNETWLVLGGGGLYAVFPLGLRGADAGALRTDHGDALRSRLPRCRLRVPLQGPARTPLGLGHLLLPRLADGGTGAGTGARRHRPGHRGGRTRYAGGWLDWLTPFSVMTAIAVVIGYALLGATWLIWKCEGPMQAHFRAKARLLGGLMLAMICIVSLWTPALDPQIAARWFAFPQILYTAPVPLMVLGLAVLLFNSLASTRDATPFLASLGLFLVTFAGLGISLYPPTSCRRRSPSGMRPRPTVRFSSCWSARRC